MITLNTGLALQSAISTKRVTQKEVAESLGWHQQRISQLTNQKNASSTTIAALANYFDLRPSEFISLGEID